MPVFWCSSVMRSTRKWRTNDSWAQNHNPAAQNGFDSAWNILSPIWASQNIKVLGTKFNNTQGWLHYSAGSFGEVVDRYRWEAGCIAEHVSWTLDFYLVFRLMFVIVGSGREVPYLEYKIAGTGAVSLFLWVANWGTRGARLVGHKISSRRVKVVAQWCQSCLTFLFNSIFKGT